MIISRRTLLKGASALTLAAGTFGPSAFAQTAPTAPAAQVPPVLFVHGNGDHAGLWITTLWRMESNGVARDRMLAINFTDPLARSDDAVAQPNRSSTEDQRRELGEAIKELKRRTGASRVALVGNSRGGNSIRSYIKNGGGADVSHAVLCGVPNHGIFDWDDMPGSEFNGRGPFLRGLNEGDSEVTPGTAFLTLRSDGIDKYAQADGRFVGKPGTPTGITPDGPALKGATNLVLGAIDHRETAFHPRAFREIYKFIAGREPAQIAIAPEAEVKLSGLVTGTPGGVQTNRPVAGASVDVHRVSPDTGERLGGPVHSSQTGADGRWGRRRSIPPGISRSCSPRPARPPRISTGRRFRAPPTSCICAPRARWDQPMRPPARSSSCRGRAAISAFPATWCCSMGRSLRMSKPACPPIRSPPCGCRPRRPGARSSRSSTRSGSSPGPGRHRKTGLRSPS